MELASDVGPMPMQIGVLLLRRPAPSFDLTAAVTTRGIRATECPGSRHRPVPTPFGCGRPVWVDDPGFDARAHVTVRACPRPGDEAAVLDTTLAVVTDPLPRSRPLWAATFLTGLRDGAIGLVIMLHHVLADGIGGLAVLSALVDGGSPLGGSADRAFPRPGPGLVALAADAWTNRLHTLARSRRSAQRGGSVRRAGRGPDDVRPLDGVLAQPAHGHSATATGRPTDPDAVRAAAHARGGTVNDLVLSAIIGLLATLLRGRGEPVPARLVVSVMVSARPTKAARPGNHVGAIPVALPTAGVPLDRMQATPRSPGPATSRPLAPRRCCCGRSFG